MAKNLEGLRVFITGGSGFIGSHLVKRCLSEGAQVAVLNPKADSLWRLEEVKEQIAIFEGSITEGEKLQQIIHKFRPQLVFHLAALLSRERSLNALDELFDVHVNGTKLLLQSLLGNSQLTRFIHVGTAEEYGRGEAPFRETQRELPVSPYSLTKLMATKMVEYAGREHGFLAVIVRPSLVYGPAQDFQMFVPSLIRSCLEKKDFDMTLGEQTRDFIFVEDLVEGILISAQGSVNKGEIINLGSGKEIPMREVAAAINEMMGSPIALRFGAIPLRDGEIMRYQLDITKAKAKLAWEPKVDLKEGLQKTIDWYAENYETVTATKVSKPPVP